MRKFFGVVIALLAVALAIWAVWAVRTSGEPAPDDPLDRSAASESPATGHADHAPGADASDTAGSARRRVHPASAGGARPGVVLDLDGSPAAGAVVIACTERDPSRVVATETADALGRFDVEPFVGHEIVALFRGVSCSAWTDVHVDATPVTLQLRHGASVTGHVRYEDGADAAGVQLGVQFAPGPGPLTWEMRSDSNGRYVVSGIPEGAWVRPCVWFSGRHGPRDHRDGPFAFGARDRLVADGRAHVAGGDGDVFERDLVARYFPMAEVTFVLRFPDGADVPREVLVESWDADRSGHSAGPVSIDPRDPQFTQDVDLDEAMMVHVRAGAHAGESQAILLTTEDARTVTIEMRPVCRLVGRLVHADGTPAEMAGIDVQIGMWRGDSGFGDEEATTDTSGHADLTQCVPLPSVLDHPGVAMVFAVEGPGVFHVSTLCEAPNLRVPGPELAALLRSGGDVVTLDIPLIEPPVFVVTTVDHVGRPVPGVPLVAAPDETFAPNEATTGPDGRATFRILAPPDAPFAWNDAGIRAGGAWTGGHHFRGIGAHPGPRDGGNAEIVVTHLPTYRVHVIDEDGVGIADAVLLVGRDRFVTDEDGWADVRGLPGSSVHLSMRMHRGVGEALPEDGDTVTLVAIPLRSVQVRVEHTDPAWTGSVRCEATAGGDERWMSPTLEVRPDAEPTTQVILPFLPGRVRVASLDFLWEGVENVTADQAEVTVTLSRIPRHTVTFRFLDSDRTPVAATRVTLRLRDAPHLLDGELVTDVNGEVRVDLPAGELGFVESQVDDETWRALTTVRVPARRPIEILVLRDEE